MASIDTKHLEKKYPETYSYFLKEFGYIASHPSSGKYRDKLNISKPEIDWEYGLQNLIGRFGTLDVAEKHALKWNAELEKEWANAKKCTDPEITKKAIEEIKNLELAGEIHDDDEDNLETLFMLGRPSAQIGCVTYKKNPCDKIKKIAENAGFFCTYSSGISGKRVIGAYVDEKPDEKILLHCSPFKAIANLRNKESECYSKYHSIPYADEHCEMVRNLTSWDMNGVLYGYPIFGVLAGRNNKNVPVGLHQEYLKYRINKENRNFYRDRAIPKYLRFDG